MNVLNNIWLALSTPNETLISIFSIPFIFLIEMPLSFYLICNLLNIQYTKKAKYIYIISTAIIAVFANYCMSWPYNILFNYATAFIVLFFVLKLGFIKSSIATLFPSIVFNLVGSLLANPYFDLL